MESKLNDGVSPRVGKPPGSALSASNFLKGLLALSLDSILGEMIDTKEWTHQPPPERPSYYMTADHEALVFLRITFTK